MRQDQRQHGNRPSGRRRERGVTLLELCAALAVSAVAAVTFLSGLRPLACTLRVQAARGVLQDVLFAARRRAYVSEIDVTVETAAGAAAVVRQPPGTTHSLGDGVRLVSGPSDGDVRFRASGLADNATLQLGCGDAVASVVVNQRGVIR